MNLKGILVNKSKKNNYLNKKFLFRHSKVIKLVSLQKLKIWRFNRYKYQLINSFFIVYIPRLIRFISYFENNKVIKNFVYKTSIFYNKNVDHGKILISKKKNRFSIFIIYFKYRYFEKFFLNKFQLIHKLKNFFIFNRIVSPKFDIFFNLKKSRLFEYSFSIKKKIKWVRKYFKKIYFSISFPSQYLTHTNSTFFLDSKKNNIYYRKIMNEVKSSKNSNYFYIKNLVYFSLNLNIEFRLQNLNLWKYFEQLYIDTFYKKKNIFVIFFDKFYFKEKKYFYEIKKHIKTIRIGKRFKTKNKKKFNSRITYSYYILNLNKNKYIAVDFECNFCFLLKQKNHNFWGISSIDGFIIAKKYSNNRKLQNKFKIETNNNLIKLKKIVFKKNTRNNCSGEIIRQVINLFSLITGIIGKKIGGYMYLNNKNLKNLVFYKTKLFKFFILSKKKLFENGIKIISFINNPILYKLCLYSKHFKIIYNFILRKTKIKKFSSGLNKFKSKKKRLFKKEKHIENLNKNGKRYNKIKKKFFSKFDSKYIQFNYRQDELPFKKKTEIKVKIEQKLKSLLELTKKNNNLLLNSKKFFLNLIKKKTCCFKFNKIEEKNLFNCKSTKFSNRVGFFFSYFQTLKIFFIYYKFCFYFMMLNEIYK